MSRFVLVLLVALAILSAGSSAQQCGLNEEFKSCGSSCEPTCGVPKAQACTLECKTGCQCKNGFMRNSENECVTRENC
ncbi:chymotrypsin inhibitor-like [Hylaeus anthracinus]|uniref:chymotrypsin inhibitor-like n=1 Tax=Hylaeus anthracinus TaxID=313031 RepID=UPI0023B8DC6A|nr:chymotrypsin inhibitor-like [Hylaeus anthracinus]